MHGNKFLNRKYKKEMMAWKYLSVVFNKYFTQKCFLMYSIKHFYNVYVKWGVDFICGSNVELCGNQKIKHFVGSIKID